MRRGRIFGCAALAALVVFVWCGTGFGSLISVDFMNSGPVAPAGVAEQIVEIVPGGALILDNVPTSSWTYGCSPTSAGMLFGYYDRIGYSNMYTGLANGGVAPLSDLGGQSSLIATKKGFDGRSSYGHVDDYWRGYDQAGPDPWEGVRSEHEWGDCLADYMGTNQWKWDYIGRDGVKDFNTDGATALFSYNGPERLYDHVPGVSSGLPQTALCHGMRLFAESRGYEVAENYTQKVDALYAGGFSFYDYMVQIDSGNPVLINVTGHTMLGVGYDEMSETVYLHDTWGDYVGEMSWGGDYSGMNHQSVTVFDLVEVPEPGTMIFLCLGGMAVLVRKNKL